MSLVEILLTIALISVFCLGIRVLLSEGQIFHFIREPFEYENSSKLMNLYRRKLQRYALTGTDNIVQIRKDFAKKSARLSYILKPLILCPVCFPSIWGSSLFITLHGLQWQLLPCIIGSTFIIKVINDKVDW